MPQGAASLRALERDSLVHGTTGDGRSVDELSLMGSTRICKAGLYQDQQDEEVRETGTEKMIGRDLLTGFSATLYQLVMDIYLPAGDWVDYRTNEWIHSKGEWIDPYPLEKENQFQLPVFIRAGGIIPLMHVDDQTMNITGQRLDGTTRDELILRIAASAEPSAFTLYEDDGASTAYQAGEVRTTEITQVQDEKSITIRIEPAQGTFDGAAQERDTIVRLSVDRAEKPAEITLNGIALVKAANVEEWGTLGSGWYQAGDNLIHIKTGVMGVNESKELIVTY